MSWWGDVDLDDTREWSDELEKSLRALTELIAVATPSQMLFLQEEARELLKEIKTPNTDSPPARIDLFSRDGRYIKR